MKVERGIMTGHASVTIARPERSKNWYKTKLESEIVFSRRRADASFLARECDVFFALAFSPCGVQGKPKFLLCFGSIVSAWNYVLRTHWNSGGVRLTCYFVYIKNPASNWDVVQRRFIWGRDIHCQSIWSFNRSMTGRGWQISRSLVGITGFRSWNIY